jgi:DNA polymerase gamma 1
MTYINQVGQPMIPDELFKAVLPDCERKHLRAGAMAEVRKHLAEFDIPCPIPPLPRVVDVKPKLPALLGENIEEHFEAIAQDVLGDLDQQVRNHFKRTPEKPTEFMIQPGWTRYVPGKPPQRVTEPIERVLTFDDETLVKRGNYTCMRGAVSTEAWYIWLHPAICVPNMLKFERQLVPIGTGRILIGHNVGFDRARVAEEYDMQGSGNFFLDTMSMHTATSGLGAEQRKAYAGISYKPEHVRRAIRWFSAGSPKNLVDCYNFHVHDYHGSYKGPTGPGLPMQKEDKEIRDIFVEAEGPHIIHMRIQELIMYMLNDVEKTKELASRVYPKYRFFNPSWVTLAATVVMGSSLLPVVDEWEEWRLTCEAVFNSISRDIEGSLYTVAEKLHDQWLNWVAGKIPKGMKAAEAKAINWLEGSPWEHNPWLSKLDWLPSTSGKTKGHALWWRKAKKKGERKFTAKGRTTPYLLELSWFDKPIYHTKAYGWVFDVENESEARGLHIIKTKDGRRFCRVPHKKGGENNCGNPLGKDYISSYENGIMTSSNSDAENVLKQAAAISYWASVQSRVTSQIVERGYNPYGADCNLIVPQLEVHGTATRRSVERLWLTTCGTKKTRVGSELKSRVQAPEGWTVVAADFDAQEMAIASRMCDSIPGLLGATAMGFTVMSGSKDDGTDAHSQLRDYLNRELSELRGWKQIEKDVWVDRDGNFVAFVDQISRGDSKAPGFAIIYGSGAKGLKATLKMIRKEWTDEECEAMANAALELRRGRKVKTGSGEELWIGGTDSNAFNFMGRLANSLIPKTPMLKSNMTTALRKSAVGRDYMTSRTNWGVQSSGQDLTHAVIVGFTWLCQKFDIKARFMLQYHDELLTMAQEDPENVMKAAAALNVAHLWAQAHLSRSLGLDDVPANNAFFSGTNIDYCFRKEVTDSQISVSWEEEILPGICLSPEDIFEDDKNPLVNPKEALWCPIKNKQ